MLYQRLPPPLFLPTISFLPCPLSFLIPTTEGSNLRPKLNDLFLVRMSEANSRLQRDYDSFENESLNIGLGENRAAASLSRSRTSRPRTGPPSIFAISDELRHAYAPIPSSSFSRDLHPSRPELERGGKEESK